MLKILTVRRCIQYADDWGFGSFYITNLFAFRATDPRDMKAYKKPIGKLNDRVLTYLAQRAAIVVAALGTHGNHLNRADTVLKMLPNLAYLKLTKDGIPGHPLYLQKSLKSKSLNVKMYF